MEEVEVWKDIEGYEGIYQISNEGRVRSLDRIAANRNRNIKGKILKLTTDKDGYKELILSKDANKTHHKVHRLVAIAFIPNPDNLPDVNHKDEDKSNNKISNLEFCSRAYNINYGSRNSRVAQTLRR